MQKSFSFKGLTKNSDDLLVADGECAELINLKYRNNCIVPITSVYEKKGLDGYYEKIYWHSAADRFLCIENDSGRLHIYDKEWNMVKGSDGSPEHFPELAVVERIEFISSIVCCITDCTTYYLLFDTGNYRWLGERPDMPELSFSIKSLVYSVTSEDKYLPGISESSDDVASRWGNVSKGYYDECLSHLHGKGYYVDRALFRFALRLFDGNYLCYSPIYYVDDDSSVNGLSRDGGNFKAQSLDSGTTSRYKAMVQGFLPSFDFKNFNLGAWENVVVAVDLFTSGSIYGNKLCVVGEEWTYRSGTYYSVETSGYERYFVKDNRELWNEVISASLFYKVVEYDIWGVVKDKVKDVSLNNLALCDTLPDDAGSMVSRSAGYSYVFNGRLHLAGLRECFFKGYNSLAYLPAGVTTAVADYATVVTKIKTSTGISLVKQEYDHTFALGVQEGEYYLTPFITYPDSRAYETIFIITIGGVVYKKLFRLKAHKSLNMAVYLNAEDNDYTVTLSGNISSGIAPAILSAEDIKSYFSYVAGEYVIVYGSDDLWYYGDKEFLQKSEIEGGRDFSLIKTEGAVVGDMLTVVIEKSSETVDLSAIDDIVIDDSWEILDEHIKFEEVAACELRGCVMKVSATDNPFYFPAKNTYTPSQNDITALCSNTIALSQGQFGQHPLYVFCKDGIWAMTSDSSGSVTYAEAHPVSREVCTNAMSICGIDSGVVFVSGRGVMLLQGSSLGCLSEAMDSDKNMADSIADGDIFYRIASLSGCACFCRVPFRTYLNGAVIGYNSAEKELLIANHVYDYTYIFSLENGTWAKTAESYNFFINQYPGLIASNTVDEKSHISVLDRDTTTGYTPVFLLTRPQLCGTKLPKRIMQLMLHASVRIGGEAGGDNIGLGCYLLCSNDGTNFKMLSGVERDEDFKDIVFPFFPTHSYKYYVLAIAGNVSNDSVFVGAELSLECVWNNRLR